MMPRGHRRWERETHSRVCKSGSRVNDYDIREESVNRVYLACLLIGQARAYRYPDRTLHLKTFQQHDCSLAQRNICLVYF